MGMHPFLEIAIFYNPHKKGEPGQKPWREKALVLVSDH